MKKEESLKLLTGWINYLRQSVPSLSVYWEESVREGDLMGEEKFWPKFNREHLGLNKRGFFASQDMTHAGYIDPMKPENTYFLNISSKIINIIAEMDGIIPEITGLVGETKWTEPNQYQINPDGTYTYVWGGQPLYDITSLVLRYNYYSTFLNWDVSEPWEVKE